MLRSRMDSNGNQLEEEDDYEEEEHDDDDDGFNLDSGDLSRTRGCMQTLGAISLAIDSLSPSLA